MKSFQQKRGWRNILQSRPVLVFLFFLLFIFAWGVFGFMGKMRATSENRKIAENKVAQLQKQKANLQKEISSLNTEDGREESIRERFPVAKEGEEVIMIIEDKNKPEVKKEDSGGFFSFFVNLFK